MDKRYRYILTISLLSFIIGCFLGFEVFGLIVVGGLAFLELTEGKF